MKNIDIIHTFAGSLIIISLSLSLLSQWWLVLTLLIGINLFQFGFTGFCPLDLILKKVRK